MPFIPTTDCAEAVHHFNLDSQDLELTQWFLLSTPPITLTNLEALALAVGNWVTTTLVTILPQPVVAQFGVYTDQTSQTGPEFTADYAATPGSHGTVAMPNNVTIAVSLRTGVRGRSFRGRNYVPGLDKDSVVANAITPTYASEIIAAFSALSVAVSAIGWQHVVVSHFSGTNPTPPPPSLPRPFGLATVITSYLLTDFTVDSQRRRLPGRGR